MKQKTRLSGGFFEIRDKRENRRETVRQSRELIKRLPCVKGFASVRSTLAGVAETGSETAQRLGGFASVRSTLAGVAETGSEFASPV